MSLNRDGEISISSKGADWAIPNFFNLPQIHDVAIDSPSFNFRNRKWKLCIYPNGSKCHSSLNWFGIIAYNCMTNCSKRLLVHLAIANGNEKIIVSSPAKSDNFRSYRCMKLISRSEFESYKHEFMPNNTLHVLFSIGNKKAESPFHTEVNKVEKGFNKLQQDLNCILHNGNLSDVIIKVEDKEFKSHRCILAARSEVFLAMMTHDTKEKATGIVEIKNIDAKIFFYFLGYLYTSCLENTEPEIIQKLYLVADMYQVHDLKQFCMDNMLKNISVANFCHLYTFSLFHEEKYLIDGCSKFFVKHSLKIVKTSEWNTFLAENPVEGNELYIKKITSEKMRFIFVFICK